MPFVDFAELKNRVSINQAITTLRLDLKPHGQQFRGACPVCKTGGNRALVVTPDKNLFYCFTQKTGGDQIALAAHIKGCSISEAATYLGGDIATATKTLKNPATVPPAPAGHKPGFDPNAYAGRFDPAHASLAALGISAETLRHWKAGYAGSGTNRGRLVVALHDRDGHILGFAGRTLGQEQPTLTIPNGIIASEIIFGEERVEHGTLYLVRDVLDVLRAHDNGVSNCVCFLTDISGLQVEMLAALMATKHCETLEVF